MEVYPTALKANHTATEANPRVVEDNCRTGDALSVVLIV
jgi:hypothetical protein